MADIPTKVRGLNYSTEEHVSIARAYIHISNDPVNGREKKYGTYYARIYHDYMEIKPIGAPLCTESYIETRIKNIQKQ